MWSEPTCSGGTWCRSCSTTMTALVSRMSPPSSMDRTDSASSAAYGGSTNTEQNFSPFSTESRCSATVTFPSSTRARSFKPKSRRFRCSAARARESRSTKVARLAPRDRASIPSAPVPANKSNTGWGGSGPRMLNIASRTLAPVGRVVDPRGARSFRPRSAPAMTRILGVTYRGPTRESMWRPNDETGYAPAMLDALLDTHAVRQLIDLALEEDLGRGDVTSQAVLAPSATATAHLVAREALVLAGLPIATAVFRRVDATINVLALAKDGDQVAAGARVATYAGRALSLLAAERTALNFVQRLSGTATLARAFVKAAEGSALRIADTRKTTPGFRLLEKYAVRMGGASNHRFDLGSGVLIKDNHVAVAGGVGAAVH